MSKRTILGLAAALTLGGLGAVSTAQAAPLGVGLGTTLAGQAPIETVAQGCGPGWGRGAYGRCRPFAGPGRGFYGRRCFFRPTPYGPRRFCRW